MGLYLGNSKVKLLMGGKFYTLNLYLDNPIKITLMSSDEFILQDANGINLLSGDYRLPNMALQTIDYYALIDLNGKYLLAKEEL